MGDRVSISFRHGEEESVCLFSHWGGMRFVEEAQEYAKELEEWVRQQQGVSHPLHWLDPSTVMVDFIRHVTRNLDRVRSNYYLGATVNDGDNADNGHFVIKLED